MNEHTPSDFVRVDYLDACTFIAATCEEDMSADILLLDWPGDDAQEVSEHDAREFYLGHTFTMNGRHFLYIEDGVAV